ncbi:dapper homolog 3 isoform X3 [Pimephales promelas]|uniref:dapper homolog 3 isoform X3 n=1 Tax=Pimephales promelas TaxID=90988 RepID=UPI001955491F|nr:dapper homolog 3 isoform X3 [Pimephales promelas]
MFRLFSSERGRQKQRLELSLAGICELELLKRRHEALVISALALHAPEPNPRCQNPNPRCPPPEGVWSLMKLLQHQVGELKMDAAEALAETSHTHPGSAASPALEGVSEDEPWVWPEEEPSAEDYRQAQRVETYIIGLIQRRSPHARPSKPPRTSTGPEARVIRQSSVSRAGIRSTSLDFPSSSEAESPQRAYTHTHSSDELVNAQYIPAQPCRALAHKPERKPKKCRFTEDKIAAKKPGRKTCRAQSENNLERKYNTAERNVTAKIRRGSAHRRWRSTLELSQDEAEQPIRRSRKPRVYRVESESSLSEAESRGSSSRSSDSDGSSGLVWPQQLAPPTQPGNSSGLVWPQQLAPPPLLAPPTPPGNALQPKAFVKIKASHALKKKILRFRTGSLKVMTTV